MNNSENEKVDEVLEELMKNQFANDTKQFATIMKNFHDSFLHAGFSRQMAEKMTVAMAANAVAQGKS